MQTHVYLIRHGETEWNRNKRFQGQQDIPLSKNGLRQAERCATAFGQRDFDAIYSSDLKRAFETAQSIASRSGRHVFALPELRERTYGQFEGLTREEIEQQFGGFYADERYGVESLTSLQQRMYAKISELVEKHRSQTIVIVSHGGAINAFLHKITDGRIGTGITRLSNTGITSTTYSVKGWEVHEIDDTQHLQKGKNIP